MRFLVDTNVLSEPTKANPAPGVLEGLRTHSDQIATASVVWHELRFGVARLPEGRRRQELTRYLDAVETTSMPVLPYDQTAAEWHARSRARLAANGTPPSFADGQIAAIAATNNLAVVTRNTADFERLGVEAISWWPPTPVDKRVDKI